MERRRRASTRLPWLGLSLLLILGCCAGCGGGAGGGGEQGGGGGPAGEGFATASSEPGGEYPRYPWPPPQPTAQTDIPAALVVGSSRAGKNLYDVGEELNRALDSQGYYERSYYAGPPDGFALATKLEQFSEDGTSKKPPDRWAAEVRPMGEFSLGGYVRALFMAEPGYYRVIVFVVTRDEVDPDEETTVGRQEAMDWVKGGANKLPEEIGSLGYTDDYTTTALVYEFVQPGRGKDPAFRKHSPLLARDHLTKARIWGALEATS